MSLAAWLPFSHFGEVSSRYRCAFLEILWDNCKVLQYMKSLRLPWNLLRVCITDTRRLPGVRSWSSEKTGCASGGVWRRMHLYLHPEAQQCWPPAAGRQRCPGSGAPWGTCVHPGVCPGGKGNWQEVPWFECSTPQAKDYGKQGQYTIRTYAFPCISWVAVRCYGAPTVSHLQITSLGCRITIPHLLWTLGDLGPPITQSISVVTTATPQVECFSTHSSICLP